MLVLLKSFFAVFFSSWLFADSTVRIEVRNPEPFRIRRLTQSNLLVNSWETMPDSIHFDVPQQFVVRDSEGRIQIEPTLESWRMGRLGGQGSPIVHPPLGTCSYIFQQTPPRLGCDFYPFQGPSGETRYVALRYMAREAENTSLGESDIRYVEQEVQGAEGLVDRVPVYNRSEFFEIRPDGTADPINKPVDLAARTAEEPVIRGLHPRSWVEDEDDLTNVPLGTIQCSENTGDPFQCMMCNCHHESNFVYENGNYRRIGYEGRFAVAATVKTRVGMDSYPNSICDVIWFNGTTASGRQVAHYTWTLDGEGEEVVSGENYQRCYRPVRDVLEGLNSHFASHYHTPNVDPGWECFDENGNRSQGTYIDGHIFYDTCDRRRRATPERMTPIEVSR